VNEPLSPLASRVDVILGVLRGERTREDGARALAVTVEQIREWEARFCEAGGRALKSAAAPRTTETPTPDHFRNLARFALTGKLVPFFGAGVNLFERPGQLRWTGDSQEHLPNGSELAQYLAATFDCPLPDDGDLARVSQYIALTLGSGDLYETLHHLFNRNYPPTDLHRFFARLPGKVRRRSKDPEKWQFPLLVTTNYDDLLERALTDEGEPFDLVVYIAEGKQPPRGRFLHVPADPQQEPAIILTPNDYAGLSLARNTVVLKIHGSVDRTNQYSRLLTDAPNRGRRPADSFVVTEDHYIEYLTHTDLNSFVPFTLSETLRSSHFLFLGYGLRDWNLRVLLHRIAGGQWLGRNSWAVQRDPTNLDERFWQKREVEIFNLPLEDYMRHFGAAVDAMVPPT
jgi:hypothetical protein